MTEVSLHILSEGNGEYVSEWVKTIDARPERLVEAKMEDKVALMEELMLSEDEAKMTKFSYTILR